MVDKKYAQRDMSRQAIRSLDLELRQIRGNIDPNMVEQIQEKVEIKYNLNLKGKSSYGAKNEGNN